MVFRLPETYDEYLGRLSGNERSNIRKRLRRLTEAYEITEDVVQPANLPEHFQRFLQQHEAQWRAEGQLGHFRDWPGAGNFQEEVARTFADSGRLMLVRVAAGGETVGYQYNLAFNGRVHWITGSRSLNPKWEPFSPGRLLHCATVKSAIASGATMLDGLGGYYEFKRRLGADITHLQNITVTRRSSRAIGRLRAFIAVTRLVDVIYHRLWYWHAAPALRRRLPERIARMFSRGLRTRFIRSRFLVAARLPRSLYRNTVELADGPKLHTDA